MESYREAAATVRTKRRCRRRARSRTGVTLAVMIPKRRTRERPVSKGWAIELLDMAEDLH